MPFKNDPILAQWSRTEATTNSFDSGEQQLRRFISQAAPPAYFTIARVKNGWVVTVRGADQYVATDYDGILHILQEHHTK